MEKVTGKLTVFFEELLVTDVKEVGQNSKWVQREMWKQVKNIRIGTKL